MGNAHLVLLVLAGAFILAGSLLKLLRLRLRARARVTEEQMAEAMKQKKEMEALLLMPGWKLLEKAAEAQVRSRVDQVTLDPALDPYISKYISGEAQGIKTFISIPKNIVETNDAIIKEALRQEEEEGS